MPAQIDLEDDEIIQALAANHYIVAAAARALDVSRATLARRIEANPRLAVEPSDEQALLYDLVLMRIVQMACQGHMPSIRWFLSRFASERGYGPQRQRLSCKAGDTRGR